MSDRSRGLTKRKRFNAVEVHVGRPSTRWETLMEFNPGIGGKLRGCDLVALKVRDICDGDQVASSAVVMQHKTHRSF